MYGYHFFGCDRVLVWTIFADQWEEGNGALFYTAEVVVNPAAGDLGLSTGRRRRRVHRRRRGGGLFSSGGHSGGVQEEA